MKVTINGDSYRQTFSVYGCKASPPFRTPNRDTAGGKGDQVVSLTLELNEEPREVEAPKVSADALADPSYVHAVLGMRSFSQKHEHAEGIWSATKSRRSKRAPAMLLERERQK